VSRVAPLVLVAVAAFAWVLTAARMRGMDAGPGTDLGALGWFSVTWLLMMAAMMLPAVAPVAGRRGARFVGGYLASWTAAGVVAYLLFEAPRSLDLGVLAWDRAGRYVAAGAILVAAVYQLSPAKAACLARCRDPRASAPGLRGGLRHGANCIGCCAGLMAALFALGVMSLTWMGVVAALIAAERLLPARTRAVYAVAAALALLAIGVAAAPGHVPGLSVPGSVSGMSG
jgi:predicted metal-binding membrane protein